jgi:exodeoxyribonuclease VII large subunit
MEQALSLFELNRMVRQSIEEGLPDEYWVEAELSEVRENNGHCYVEFVQNDKATSRCLAKARGIIWNSVYVFLKPTFEKTTGQSFTNGISVRVRVKVSFHEVFGYSLIVSDIDPAFTLGDMAMKRHQILQQLEEDGVINLNKELQMPVLPQRIAVISSKTAAGYGDFCRQLLDNERHFYFHIELFEAMMQGEQTEKSMLEAMQKVDDRLEDFDVLVIIRGGGATSDLACFDNYLLASAVAQFRIPVITGIGHERDETVLDWVAHTRMKTPTAVAAFLIARVGEAADRLVELTESLHDIMLLRLQKEHNKLQQLYASVPALVEHQIGVAHSNVLLLQHNLQTSIDNLLQKERHRMEMLLSKMDGASPDKILAKGYSITLCDGKVVRNASSLSEDMNIVTRFEKGMAESKVVRVVKKK